MLSTANSRLFSRTGPVWLSPENEPCREILTYALLDDRSNRTYVTDGVVNNVNANTSAAFLRIFTATS